MRKQQQVQAMSRRSRDTNLRAAHQRAWAQIEAARDRADHREAVKRAVQELIDACEAFVDSREAAAVAKAS